jgi:hypothetical protein
MACSCKNKNALRNTMISRSRTGNIIRPVSGPQPVQGELAVSSPTPTSLKSAAVPTAERSFAGEIQEKKKTQKIRRDAIRRALNK